MAARTFAGVLCALLVAGCERRADDGLLELASELRADRLARTRQAAATEGIATPLSSAVQTLADVVQRLDERQRELATQQATLARELRQWSQLLVGSLQDKSAQAGEALARRLAALEQQIAEQDARHRDVEKMIGEALQHTADQLDRFLQKVEQPAPSGAREPPTQSTTGTAPTEANGQGPPESGEDDRQAAAPEVQRGGIAPRWPWYLLAGVSVVSGLLLLRSRQQAAPVALAQEMQAAPAAQPPPRPPASPPVPPPVGEAGSPEPEVEELWTAAALLGEAVGRLRQSGPAGSEDELEVAPDPPEVFAVDELFVEPPAPVEPATRPSAPPESITCRLPAADDTACQHRIEDLLAADPRVLAQPAPVVEPAPGALQVTFALLPGLPAGERILLEQRLRDAVG